MNDRRSEHDDYQYHDEDAPVRPYTQRRSSSGSTSTRSSDRSSSDRSTSEQDELPPRIIPEYSRRHSEYRSEYTAATPHTRAPTELPYYDTTERGTSMPASTSRSRSRPRERRRRTRKRSHSGSRTKQPPLILMFENGRGGYENLWYITPGDAPVVFQDADGNEITRYE